MGIINSVICLLSDFEFDQVWKYVDYHICYEDYVHKFEAMQKKLKDRVEDVEAELEAQLKQPGKKARNEVDAWLEEARKETTVKVEDLICRGGYFTFIWSSRNLDEKAEELREIREEGREFTNAGVILVTDDRSIQYRASVFEDMQKEVGHQKEKIEANLETQLRQSGKTAWKKVVEWLEKANQQVTMKVEADLISHGESSSSTNIEEKIVELKRTFEEGKEFTNVGVSLVIDDHSKYEVTLPAEKCIARDDKQLEILQLFREDKTTRIALCGIGGEGKTTVIVGSNNTVNTTPT